jgi:hypothetical protein
MPVRDIQQLKRDQAELLRAYKAQREERFGSDVSGSTARDVDGAAIEGIVRTLWREMVAAATKSSPHTP